MNLEQHLKEIDKRFDEKFESIYYGKDIDGFPNYQSDNFKEDVKSFIHAEAIELVKKVFEETQLQEADRTVIDDNILQQLSVNGMTIGWNNARSAILEKQKDYLCEQAQETINEKE